MLLNSKVFGLPWPQIDASLGCRCVTGQDKAFLQTLYASSRPDLAGLPLPADALQNLLTQQQNAQELGFTRVYPGAEQWAIEHAAEPIGRVVLHHADNLRVLDIAVLAKAQRQGVARRVLRAVQALASAEARTVTLAVAHSNVPAQALYRSLGFTEMSRDELFMQMHWCAASLAP